MPSAECCYVTFLQHPLYLYLAGNPVLPYLYAVSVAIHIVVACVSNEVSVRVDLVLVSRSGAVVAGVAEAVAVAVSLVSVRCGRAVVSLVHHAVVVGVLVAEVTQAVAVRVDLEIRVTRFVFTVFIELTLPPTSVIPCFRNNIWPPRVLPIPSDRKSVV